LTITTGVLAVVAIYYTATNAWTARRALAHTEESARRTYELTAETARRTAALTEQGQVTERYTKAIEQLGSATSCGIGHWGYREGSHADVMRVSRPAEPSAGFTPHPFGQM